MEARPALIDTFWMGFTAADIANGHWTLTYSEIFKKIHGKLKALLYAESISA